MAAKRRVNNAQVFTRRGTGGIVPLKAYGRPGTFGCAVAEKLAVTGLTEAEYVQIAQKHGTSQNRFKAYIDYFKEQGFNIVLENGRYVEKTESSVFLGSSTQTQTRKTVLDNQFINSVEVNVNIDDKFLKDLKVAVKPETLITDSIWFEWFNAFNGTDVFEKKVIQVAKSKKLIWPSSKSDETFGDYLAMQFSKVKNSLGWDAKRTLLVSLAEEYSSFKKGLMTLENNIVGVKAVNSTQISGESKQDTTATDDKSRVRIGNLCDKSVAVINELISNNKINNDLIHLLEEHVSNISSENLTLAKKTGTYESELANTKHLLDEMIKMSQDQIIDIDELSRENNRLVTELESYKAKYYSLKTSYDRLRIGNYNIDSCNSNTMKQSNSITVESLTAPEKKESKDLVDVAPKVQPERRDDMKFLRSLAVSDYSNDIKI